MTPLDDTMTCATAVLRVTSQKACERVEELVLIVAPRSDLLAEFEFKPILFIFIYIN